jgi:hypothetical protein
MGHRTARRAYPEGQFAPMKWVNIKDLWYKFDPRCKEVFARMQIAGPMRP